MPVQAALGAVIKARRIELGWTQEELAERISADGEYVRQSEISRIENGKIALPRRERLERIATTLDLPLGELLARSGWAGAEPHFQPAAEPLTASIAPPPVTEPARLPGGSCSGSDIQPYDPAALAAFRQALARMREESDRLQRNRITSLATQQRFQQTVAGERAEAFTGSYSDDTDG